MTPPLTGFFSRIVLAAVILAGSSLFATADEWRTSGLADRRVEIRREFPALRLRQPGRAEGRHAELRRGRHVRQLQPVSSCTARRRPALRLRRRPALRHADGAGDRRRQHQPPADRRRLQISRRFFLGDLPPRPARQMARRQADHRRRRDLVVQRAEGQQPDVQPLLSPTSPRRWRSPIARSSSISTRRAIASCRKIIGDLVVLPKHWWEGTDANGKKRDITKPTLEPPLGSGAYKIESFKPGAEIVWSRVKDYWARQTAGECRPREFRHGADTSISRTTMPRGRPSPKAASRTSGRKTAPGAGRRNIFPGGQGRRRHQAGIQERRPASRCRASCSICAGRNSRTAASARR